MGGMEMDYSPTDQAWQKLQVHIDEMFGRYLGDSLDMIEYNPGHAVHLLSMSLDGRNNHPEAL